MIASDAPPSPLPTRSMWWLLMVIGGVLFLMLYDEPFFDYVFRDTPNSNAWAQAAVLVCDVGLPAALTRGRWRAFAPTCWRSPRWTRSPSSTRWTRRGSTLSLSLIPLLIVGLIMERGLRVDNLHLPEQRALIGYTLAVVVLGEVGAMAALIPPHEDLAGTWGQYTLLALAVNGLGVALATIVVLGAGAHPEWERAHARPLDS